MPLAFAPGPLPKEKLVFFLTRIKTFRFSLESQLNFFLALSLSKLQCLPLSILFQFFVVCFFCLSINHVVLR